MMYINIQDKALFISRFRCLVCNYPGCISYHIIKTHITKEHGPEAFEEWKAYDWKSHDWSTHVFKEVKNCLCYYRIDIESILSVFEGVQ